MADGDFYFLNISSDANIIYGQIHHKKKKKRTKRGSGSETSGSTMIDSNVSEGTSVRNLQKQKVIYILYKYVEFKLQHIKN